MKKKSKPPHVTISTRGDFDSPFTILIDTSEKLPYKFENIRADKNEKSLTGIISVKKEKSNLYVGDYAIKEYPKGIIIERKSHEDLFHSFSNGHEREKMRERIIIMGDTYERSCVIVESCLEDIMTNQLPFTNLSPKTIVRTIMSWSLRYPKTHWHMTHSRRVGEIYTYRLLDFFYSHKNEKSK